MVISSSVAIHAAPIPYPQVVESSEFNCNHSRRRRWVQVWTILREACCTPKLMAIVVDQMQFCQKWSHSARNFGSHVDFVLRDFKAWVSKSLEISSRVKLIIRQPVDEFVKILTKPLSNGDWLLPHLEVFEQDVLDSITLHLFLALSLQRLCCDEAANVRGYRLLRSQECSTSFDGPWSLAATRSGLKAPRRSKPVYIQQRFQPYSPMVLQL